MTSKVISLDYASRATYGSVAYDMGKVSAAPSYVPQNIPETVPEVPEARPDVKVKSGEKTKTRARAKAKAAAQGQYVSVFSIAGAVFAVALFVLVIFSYIQLNEISYQSAELKNKISQLTEEETKLQIAYEETFDIDNVEAYATGVLGMTMPSAAQSVDVSSKLEDKAEILKVEDSNSVNVISEIGSMLSSALEYLGISF